jgi:hypothetical protein
VHQAKKGEDCWVRETFPAVFFSKRVLQSCQALSSASATPYSERRNAINAAARSGESWLKLLITWFASDPGLRWASMA